MEEKSEKVKEKVEVKEALEQKVKDFSFSVNTGQSGRAEFVTKKITGDLQAIIINSDKPVGIAIALDEMESVKVFKDIDFTGTKFIPITTHPVDDKNKVLINEHTKWVLNDKLKFIVMGAINTTINFTVRWR